MTDTPAEQALLARFPKVREPLPPDYQRIYEESYSANRGGQSAASKGVLWLEAWMHRQVARSHEFPLLEIGAGPLNHVPYEPAEGAYDAVEPEAFLLRDKDCSRIRKLYASTHEIAADTRYARIVSVAVLEHVLDLPDVMRKVVQLLEPNGVVRAGIPSEGALGWYLGWKYGTGPIFRRKYGLDYSVMMRHEHINSAAEVVGLFRYFFHDVKVKRFPLPLFALSFYTAIEARRPRR